MVHRDCILGMKVYAMLSIIFSFELGGLHPLVQFLLASLTSIGKCSPIGNNHRHEAISQAL